MYPAHTKIEFKETVTLMALLMSLVALSIDMVLPALGIISNAYHLENHNHIQYVITFVFIGLSLGQLFFGPLSDSIGRKKAIYIGLGCFILGSLVSALAHDYPSMLIGRFLQGVGVSAPRVLTVAMVRDQYAGRAMAQIMSIIMMIFIMVPALAPLLGKVILTFADWHFIFLILMVAAIIAGIWLYLRHPETLALEHRIPFTFTRIRQGAIEVLSHPISLGYTLAAGVIFGAFMGFLNSVQLVFDIVYQQEENFPYYFALIALSIGLSSAFNSKTVIKLGMRFLCYCALSALLGITLIFLALALYYEGRPLLGIFVVAEILTFFCMGILFGNFNALAMEPMGHLAGLASSVIGSLTAFISMAIGFIIGQMFNETLLPLISGFAICTIVSLLIMLLTEYYVKKIPVSHT